ncbi:MAG: hypothetical protein H7Z70_08425 [Bacteroidia bacterium]|nr:hypothetical protein [Methylotenera sp.]
MTAITIKDAVKTAKEKIIELYEDDIPQALALEEIEFIEDGARKLWSVTLGFHRNKSVKAINTGVLDLYKPSQVENRVYKTILIDANTGDFVRMDMRLI